MPVLAAARQLDRPGARWFASPVAQRLMREEQRQTLPMLAGCYGQIGVYLRGHPMLPPSLPGSMVQSLLHAHRDTHAWSGDLAFSDAAWPLQRESVDLVYLLHVLEVLADPAVLLDEMERVLAPDGVAIIVAFAPLSPWRLRWAGRGLQATGAGLASELLRDAGFEVQQHQGIGPVWPRLPRNVAVSGPQTALRGLVAPLQASYALLARKRRAGLTPLRTRVPAVALKPGVHAG